MTVDNVVASESEMSAGNKTLDVACDAQRGRPTRQVASSWSLRRGSALSVMRTLSRATGWTCNQQHIYRVTFLCTVTPTFIVNLQLLLFLFFPLFSKERWEPPDSSIGTLLFLPSTLSYLLILKAVLSRLDRQIEIMAPSRTATSTLLALAVSLVCVTGQTPTPGQSDPAAVW